MNVNGREYHVERMPITKVLEFVPEVLEAVGPALGGVMDAFNDDKGREEVFRGIFAGMQSAKLTAVMRKSLAQVVTPEQTYLRDAAVFEMWFKDHPEDLISVAGLATWELVKDFLPLPLATLAGGFLSKAKASTSPKAGE